MKFVASAVVSTLLVGSSLLMGGCAVYPDGTPAYANGGYATPAPAYQAYPAGYAPGYYDGPVAQPTVVIEGGGGYGGGGGYYGGPGPRYYNDGHGRPPPGYNGDRGGERGGYHGGGHDQNNGGQQQGGQPGRGGPPQNAGGQGQGGHGGPGGPTQNGGGQQGRPAPAAPQQQAHGATPYVGKSNWGKPSGVQSEREH